jgi:acetylornithine deacetylase
VDLGFWTEAALLAQAGIDAVVFGPGDIAQAHAPDEFVALADLRGARAAFAAAFARSRRGAG